VRTQRPDDPAAPYVSGVLDGTIVAGPLVRLACERHQRDLVDGPGRGLRWDAVAAARPIRFIESVLKLPDSGRAFTLHAWQRFIVASLYGWLTAEGTRRFRSAFIEAAKGAGKTPLVAALMLYAFLEDGEPAAECYSAAPSRDQSMIAFRDAARMVQASPALRKSVEVLEQALFHRASGSVVRPLSAEARTLDGRRVHFGALDELQEHGDRNVIDKVRASTKARTQPLIVEITNSGWDRESVCWQHHELTREILEGLRANDEWFGYVCGLDAGDDWQDPTVWPKANPSLPTLPGVRYLREQITEAAAMPARQSIVRRLNLCEWVESSSIWLDMAAVRECAAPALDVAAFARQPVVLGVDIGATDSMTVVALLHRAGDDTTRVLVHGFLPEARLGELIARDKIPYDVWVRAGWVELTPGSIVQMDRVRTYVRELARQVTITAVAYDDWGAVSFVQQLEADGLVAVKVDQSPKGLTAACREWERLVAERKLRYGACPVLEAHVARTRVRVTDAGIMPVKMAETARIDAVSAALTALAHLIVTPPEPASVYETRGLLTV
jgi:phage terminase large subunit-like protein